jgi:hypothetical protein
VGQRQHHHPKQGITGHVNQRCDPGDLSTRIEQTHWQGTQKNGANKNYQKRQRQLRAEKNQLARHWTPKQGKELPPNQRENTIN